MNALPRRSQLSRRAVLAQGGALIVSFSLARPDRLFAQDAPSGGAPQAPKLPGSLNKSPYLDAWIKIDAEGRITVLTGKAELGQGIKTALLQIAAEQLGVAPQAITLLTADTAQTPNEGYTAGSHSMQDSGTAILNAAAQVRAILLGLAAGRLGVAAGELKAQDGAAVAPDGRRIGFGALVAGNVLHVEAQPESPLVAPQAHRIMGRSLPRVDIPPKVTGGAAFVQDLRLPGMVHGRVARPPSYGARLRRLGTERAEAMPGVLKIVRDGSFIAAIAQGEYQAIEAMRALEAGAVWSAAEAPLPNEADIFAYLRGLPAQDHTILDAHGSASPPGTRAEATYHRPYHMHGSIGPSCAVALYQNDALTLWTHSQGVFPLRNAVAELLRIPPGSIRCIQIEGSGCYGHNAADDAGADAALLARAFPGRPVRVQWMREDEHAFEPYGPAMIVDAKAALDGSGRIVEWDYQVWSNTHSTRPGKAGNLLPALDLAQPFAPPPPKPLPQPEGGGDRNAVPLYRFPNARVVHHFIPTMPLRVSALRGLGAYMNIFALESFMDELAARAQADPVEFRLRHLDDPRAREVIERAAARFAWRPGERLPRGQGRGFAFARYKNLGAYLALAIEAEVEHETGAVRVRRATAVCDSGEAVNPDGIRNQIEGGIIQSASWTLYEAVRFDPAQTTSRDWSSYPILRFPAVPDSVDVEVIDRPGEPFLGTGEAAQGPTAAAIANAFANATGVRMRDLPFSPERVKAMLGV